MMSKPKFYPMKDLSIRSKEIDILYDKVSFSSVVTSHSSEFTPCKRNDCQCESRKKSSDESFNNGRWTQEEHLKFIEAMFIFGNEWKKVQRYIKTRSSTQSRSHSQKFFIRFRRKYIEQFGEEELLCGSETVRVEHILDVLTELVHCNFIARLCRNSDVFFNGEDKVSHQELQKIVAANFPFAPANLQGFIEEKKKNFVKVIVNLIQNPAHLIKEASDKARGSKRIITSLNSNKDMMDKAYFKQVKEVSGSEGFAIQSSPNTASVNQTSNPISTPITSNNYINLDTINLKYNNQGESKGKDQPSRPHPNSLAAKFNPPAQSQDNPFQLSFEEPEEPHFPFKNEDEMNDPNYLSYFFTSNN